MKYCDNCGAELDATVKFCGDCGSPVKEDVEIEEQSLLSLEPSAQEDTKNEWVELPSDKGKKTKKIIKRIFLLVLTLAVVAGIGVLCWKPEVFHFGEQPTKEQTEQAVDENNLYKTLDWQEDQDKTYELKKSLIEGNSDGTIQEILEESAYFTPEKYMYAVNDAAQYYLITCNYEKEDKKAVYQLVFKVNHDDHLELAELYKGKKKIKEKKFDGFYGKLYKTEEDVELEQEEAEAQAVQEEQEREKEENPLALFEDNLYEATNGSYFSIYHADKNSIVAVMGHAAGDETSINMYYGKYDAKENLYTFTYSDYETYSCELYVCPDDPNVITLYSKDGEEYEYTEDYYLEKN